MENFKYQVGETIVYKGNKICRIEEISKQKLGAKPEMCYVLKPVFTENLTVYVACSNQILVDKMKRLPKKEEIDSMIGLAAKKPIEWIENHKERASAYKKIISDGDYVQLIGVIKALQKYLLSLPSGKHLNSNDEIILHDAKSRVENLFSYVMGIGAGEIADYIAAHS